MALTFSGRKSVEGNRYTWQGVVTFDSSYPTGGEAVNAATAFGFNLGNIEFLQVTAERGTEVVVWNDAARKLLVYTADGTEAPNASDQSAVTCYVRAVGL